MKEDNERRRAIEELAERNNYNLKKEELDNLAEEARMKHEENMKKINNEHEQKMNTINYEFNLKKDQQNKNHTEEMERIKEEGKKMNILI